MIVDWFNKVKKNECFRFFVDEIEVIYLELVFIRLVFMKISLWGVKWMEVNVIEFVRYEIYDKIIKSCVFGEEEFC